ncbi:MAG: hypothetical protein DRI89_15505 [Bacteroidetes bacterium]|nr:MAG: hypothetical protein DRI89_15505 [Bacteroidota bacterium]
MKTKITLSIAAILLATFFTNAQTIVTAGAVEGTWTLNQSPYEVQGAIYVDDNTTLTIEAGVVVQFNTTELFEINGRLIAEGTAQDSIVFTNYDPLIRWGGIGWKNTPTTNDTSKIAFCVFKHASSYGTDQFMNSGGAIGVWNVNKLTIRHSTFRFNKADQPGLKEPSGGAIAINNSAISISHCIFHNNSAELGGAIVLYIDSETIIDNCLFYENESNTDGGAIEVYESSVGCFINCTFADNHANRGGGAIDSYYSMPTLTNCILWGNTADEFGNQVYISSASSGLNLYYCDIEGGEADFGGQTNLGETAKMLDTIPEFMGEDELYPYYAIDGSSPCVNYGTLNSQYLPDGWVCPCVDLAGSQRIEQGIIDLGPYEALSVRTNEYLAEEIIDLRIFPNPTSRDLTINYTLLTGENLSISLYSITGQILKVIENKPVMAGTYQKQIDMKGLPDGYYIIKLRAGNTTVTKKVIKY